MFGLFQGFRDILLPLNVFEGYFGYLLTCTQHLDQTDLDIPISSWETNGITKELEKMQIEGGKSTNIYNTKLRYSIFLKGILIIFLVLYALQIFFLSYKGITLVIF